MAVIWHEGKNQFCIVENDNFLLEICPTAGGSITRFQMKSSDGQSIHIFRPFKGNRESRIHPFKTGNMTMMPFTNRIKDGILRYKGKTFSGFPLHEDEPNALHGDGYKSVWEIAESRDHFVVLTLDRRQGETPYHYTAQQKFTLTANRLIIETTMRNEGEEMPFAAGQHPWFPKKQGTKVFANVSQMAYCDENMHFTRIGPIPQKFDFFQGLAVSSLHEIGHGFGGTAFMDNAFLGEGDKGIVIQPEDGITISIAASPVTVQGSGTARSYDAKNMVMYVPPAETDGEKNDYICVEFGMPNIIDEFNLFEKGITNGKFPVLAHGEKYVSSIEFNIKRDL